MHSLLNLLSFVDKECVATFLNGVIVGVILGVFFTRKPKYSRVVSNCTLTLCKDYKDHYYTITLENGAFFSLHCDCLCEDRETCAILQQKCPNIEPRLKDLKPPFFNIFSNKKSSKNTQSKTNHS